MKPESQTKLKSIIKDILSEMIQQKRVSRKQPPRKLTKESLKHNIVTMINEEITRAKKIHEMARPPVTVDSKGVVSGLGAKFIVPDAKSPTKFSVKGHTKFEDGTPAVPPKLNTGINYVKIGDRSTDSPNAPKKIGGWMSKSDKEKAEDTEEEDAEDEGDWNAPDVKATASMADDEDEKKDDTDVDDDSSTNKPFKTAAPASAEQRAKIAAARARVNKIRTPVKTKSDSGYIAATNK